MYKKLITSCLIFFLVICSMGAKVEKNRNSNQEKTAIQHKDDYQPREILIKFKDSALIQTKDAQSIAGRTKSLKVKTVEELDRYGLKNGRGVFKHAFERSNETVKSKSKRNNDIERDAKKKHLERWYHYTAEEGVDLEQLKERLRETDEIEYVEYNYEWKLAYGFDPPVENLPDGTTDPFVPEQWYLTNAGIQQAWNYMNTNGVCGGGNSDVIVAVIDSGVDYTHEDLQASMWINSGEISGNGIDDDNNGFVDDVHGSSVVSNSSIHSGDPIDLHGHGTHVSGIIAAQAFNQKGIAGIAFNTKIMAVRAAQYSGTLTVQDIAEGIIYATENGADVINMSFGGYQYSQIVADALEVALSQAVLVAAAGNDSRNSDQSPPPLYPAALPYVIGVKATDTNNKLSWFSNSGSSYDVSAPGESILSTLPGNSYAKWSGTSMATPVVSGIAALIRSYFWQRDIYSNRFIMGTIAASQETKGIVNAYTAITTPPTPGVSMYDNWIFDSEEISPQNNGDGVIDAGETIHVGIELFNRSGLATNIAVFLRAIAPGATYDDPYVDITVPGFFVDNIGPWNRADNGFIYNEEGVVVGLTAPLIFHVSEDCPNDHVINFELTTLFNDGWNPDNPTMYERISNFQYVVTRGILLPAVISEDMELTSDEFWIIGRPVLIESGVTLTIQPGTQVQWGAMSADPYNPGPQSGNLVVRGVLIANGTASAPISFFPSYLVSGQRVNIQVEGGITDLNYTKIRNPNLTDLGSVDHCYFDWDSYDAVITAGRISNSIFHKLHNSNGNVRVSANAFDTCLFDRSHMGPKINAKLYNCTFLQDNDYAVPMTIYPPQAFNKTLTNDRGDIPFFWDANNYDGFTYVLLPMERTSLLVAELIANYFDGQVASIRDPNESAFVKSFLGSVTWMCSSVYVCTSMTDRYDYGNYRWLDGSSVDFTDWAEGYPVRLAAGSNTIVQLLDYYYGGYTWGWRNRIETNSGRWGTGGPAGWFLFLLRLPGHQELGELNAAAGAESAEILNYVKSNYNFDVRNNAFLNKYWEPNLSKWMRFYSPSGADGYCVMYNNYWGTTSTTLIDHAIVDYNDNFTTARIEYGTPAAQGYETTYPFVEQVLINEIPAVQVPLIGAGPATFTVKFNRDMSTDPNDLPLVTFGPSAPYTDYVVKPIDGGWTNAQTWKGTFWVVPVTGEGYHCIRISGAVAADDPWLVTGEDVGRIRFQIQTMGVQAMTLQASGGENRIQLSWEQDDFDLLAGYNLYRATSINGTYQKINQTIIPVGSESFVDYDVMPAVPLYYKFTVLQTDFAESDFSNIASASPLDTIPPTITHTPVYQAVGGGNLRLTAAAQDNVSVKFVTLFYRNIGAATYNQISMINTSGNSWTITLSGSLVTPPGLQYYITATDGTSNSYSGTPAMPYTVTVSNKPTLNFVSPNTGPVTGGTLVTLSGNLFQNGATVWFGQEQATDVQFVSQSQIRSMTPTHFPALVDVKVINPDLTECILTNSFTYRDDDGVVLTFPNMIGDYGTIVDIPLVISDVQGLVASSITIHYDPIILRVNQVNKGGLIPDWLLSSNTSILGTISLSMAGTSPVNGTGNLAVLQVETIASPPASSELVLYNSVLNDGAIEHTAVNGLFTVNGLFGISGIVNYYSDSTAIANVIMTLTGSGDPAVAMSDNSGLFSISEIPVGSYRLAPSKTDDSFGITSYDASLILQADAGLITLSSNQNKAADVNNNGVVSAMDAFYILQKAVDLILLPFPGNQKIWTFVPAEREYPLLNSDQVNQLFTAVLVGDVSGNWSDSVPQTTMIPLGGDMDPHATISLIDKTFLPHESMNVPINLVFDPNEEIYAVDIEIHYNGDVLNAQALSPGEMVELNNMILTANNSVPGVIKIALAGAYPMVFDGVVAVVTFNTDSLTCIPENLNLVNAYINEGAVEIRKWNGSIALSSYRSDFSRNCKVDSDDIVMFADNWMQLPADSVFDIAPILNLDGEINLADFAVLSQEWLLN